MITPYTDTIRIESHKLKDKTTNPGLQHPSAGRASWWWACTSWPLRWAETGSCSCTSSRWSRWRSSRKRLECQESWPGWGEARWRRTWWRSLSWLDHRRRCCPRPTRPKQKRTTNFKTLNKWATDERWNVRYAKARCKMTRLTLELQVREICLSNLAGQKVQLDTKSILNLKKDYLWTYGWSTSNWL